MKFNEIIFSRIVLLRKELNKTQKEMVESINAYLQDKGQDNLLTPTSYTMMENRRSTLLINFIHIVNFLSDTYEINPNWIIMEDNSKISKYNLKSFSLQEVNSNETKELKVLRKKIEEIKLLIK